MLLVALGVGAVALVTTLHAQTTGQTSPQPAPPDAAKVGEKITLEEKKLAEKFNVFMQQLSQLKDRMEKGTEEDRAFAKVLEQVIERSKNKSIDVQFQEMVNLLKDKKATSLTTVKDAVKKSENLTNDLQDLLQLIRQDKSLKDLRPTGKSGKRSWTRSTP